MLRLLAVSLVLGIALSACEGTRSLVSAVGVDEGTLECADGTDSCHNDGQSDGNTHSASQPGEDFAITPLQPGSGDSPPSGLIIYFDHDRSDIRPEFNVVLSAHGTYLLENGHRRVILVGHADDSASIEYNIGLGAQRAQSVRRALLLHGVTMDQIGTASNGGDQPVVPSSQETSNSLNRRVDLIYR